jgi:hypothetical protein
MPRLGAFARMWKRDSAAEIAEAMAAEGLVAAQWNFSALGQPTVSGDRSEEEYAGVHAAMAASGLTVWGLSCTYNLLDADLGRRSGLNKAAAQMIERSPCCGPCGRLPAMAQRSHGREQPSGADVAWRPCLTILCWEI